MGMIKKYFSSTKRAVITIIVLVIILVVVLFTSLFKGISMMTDNILQDSATIQELSKQDMSESIFVTGTVESQNVMAITTELTSKVETLEVSLGDRVEKDQVLCTFNGEDIKKQISELENQSSLEARAIQHQKDRANRDLSNAQTQSQNAINAATKDKQDAQEVFDKADAAYNNAKGLYKNREIDKADLDILKEERSQAKINLDAADDQLEAAILSGTETIRAAQDALEDLEYTNLGDNVSSNSIEDLNRQLNATTITAGQSGIITELSVERGSIPSGGALMLIEDDKNLRINVPIKEQDIFKLKAGMKAVITSEALSDKEYGGVISQVINFASKGNTLMEGESQPGGYSAIIDVDEGSDLLLGMSVKVEITTKKSVKKIAVPYDSIMEEDDVKYIFRAVPIEGSDKFKVECIDVRTGDSNDYYTAIESDDLSEGDYIITNPIVVAEGDEIDVSIPSNESDTEIMDIDTEEND